jgi:HD-GYP domain-containing protein (c-di-GMP phosphodiesterase class II)
VRLGAPVYDKTGQMLLAEGESLGRERIRMLADHGIRVVFVPEPGDSVESFFSERGNVPVEVEGLRTGTRTTQPLRDQNGVLLLKDGAEITRDFLESFRRRGIRFLYVDQTEAERRESTKNIEGFRVALETERKTRIESQLGKLADTPVEFEPGELVANAAELDAQGVGRRIAQELRRTAEETAFGAPPAQSFDKELKPRSGEEMRAADVKAVFLDSYAGMVRELHKAYGQLRRGAAVASGTIGKVVGEAMVMARDIDLSMTLAARPQTDDPLVAHAIRVGLFSLAIGLHLRYTRKQIFELAHSAFLADVGLLRVPPEILRKTVRLTDPERAEIRRHVNYGVEVCRSISGVPWISACTIYQSHERCNGSGYYEHRPGPEILPVAKIVAAADVYAALSEDRPHRRALLPCRAVEAAVRMSGMGLLDGDAVRGLLRHLSLFPVGSWAELSTGEKVRVVWSNPGDYMRPVVSVVCGPSGAPVEPFRLDLLKHRQLRLVRPLPPEGLEPADDPLRGF